MHAEKMLGTQLMHIVCCGQTPGQACNPQFNLDTMRLTAYANSLQSALSGRGEAGLGASSLYIDVQHQGVTGKGSDDDDDTGSSSQKKAAVTCRGLWEALPAMTALLPKLQSVSISSACKLVAEDVAKLLSAFKSCPLLHTLQLPADSLQPSVLLAASQLPNLRVLHIHGDVYRNAWITLSQLIPAQVEVLGCRSIHHMQQDRLKVISSIQTLTALPTRPLLLGGSINSSNGMAPGPWNGQWQPDQLSCNIQLADLQYLPSLGSMQQVEAEVTSLPKRRSQVLQLFKPLLGGQLASCAQGWAIKFTVTLCALSDEYESILWSGHLPPGGLPTVHNVVLQVLFDSCVPSELPAWAVQRLKSLFAALPGIRKLFIQPFVWALTEETKIADTSELRRLKKVLPVMLHAASIAVKRQLMGWRASNLQADGE